MRLSNRLKLIADLVSPGESVADIGTDHGFLPIYLTKEGISPKVILTDISPGSSQKAAQDCQRLDPDREYDIREGDGLTVLKKAEVDTVVIAGMGGILISHILEKDPVLTGSFRKYILQPRNHVGYLRYRLCSDGLRITEERLVREGKFICEIIVAVPREGAEEEMTYQGNEEKYAYPKTFVREDMDLANEFLLQEKKKLTDIMKKIGNSHGDRKDMILRKLDIIEQKLGEINEQGTSI